MSDQESNNCSCSEPDHAAGSNQVVESQDQPQTENAVPVSSSISHPRENDVGIDRENADFSGTADDVSISSLNENLESLESDTPLSEILCGLSPDIQTLAKEWHIKFNNNRSESLRSILQLMLQTSGLKLNLSRKYSIEIQRLTVDRVDHWKSEKNYRILIKSEMYRNNLANFLKFVLNEKILTDEEFMGKICHLINVMMKSKWTSARQTALVVGSDITNQYLQLSKSIEHKLVSDTSSSKTELLKEKLALVKKIMDSFLCLMLLFLRDHMLTIRKPMFDLFCDWIKEYPKLFLHDNYLRHILWSIYDLDTNIRASAVHVCASIITTEEIGHNLNLFISRVVPALFLRVNDAKATVAIAALKSLSAIHKKLDVFKFGSPKKIYLQIFTKRPGVSSAAASFLYQQLSCEHPKTSTTFITEILDFLHECDVVQQLPEECGFDLLLNLLPCAYRQLTDWPAWTNLLLTGSLDKDLEELACRTLTSVVSCTTESVLTIDDSPVGRYISPPGFITSEIKCKTAMKKKQIDLCEKTKKAFNNFFGKVLITLWKKYKDNPDSLLHLMSIASHFSNLVTVDVKKYFTFLLNLEYNDPEISHLKFSILASLCHLMAQSHKWKREVKTITSKLFSDLSNELLEAFVVYSTSYSEETTLDVEKNLKKLNSAYCLTKYFDLSHTTVAEEALAFLGRCKNQRQPEFVCIAANISIHIVQWQLKNLLEGKYCGDELTTSLNKLQIRIRILSDEMEHLICSTDTLVRRTAFAVLYKLLTLFSKGNKDIEAYPMIHLPHPSLDVMEWLNFHLVTEVPCDAMPEDEETLFICRQTLRHFCSLLSRGVVPLTYIQSILPYLRFYQQEENYNKILRDSFENVMTMNTFPSDLVKGLIFYNKTSPQECEEATLGLCSIVFKGAKHQSSVKAIIELGVGYSLKSRDFSFLVVVSPILKLLPKIDSNKIKNDLFKVLACANTLQGEEFFNLMK